MFDDRDMRNKWADIIARNIEHFSSIDKSESIKSFVQTYKLQARMTIMPDPNMINGLIEDNSRTFGYDEEAGEEGLQDAKNDMKQKRNVYEQLKQDRMLFD